MRCIARLSHKIFRYAALERFRIKHGVILALLRKELYKLQNRIIPRNQDADTSREKKEEKSMLKAKARELDSRILNGHGLAILRLSIPPSRGVHLPVSLKQP